MSRTHRKTRQKKFATTNPYKQAPSTHRATAVDDLRLSRSYLLGWVVGVILSKPIASSKK